MPSPHKKSLISNEDIENLRIGPRDLACDRRNKEDAINGILQIRARLTKQTKGLDFSSLHPEELEMVIDVFTRAGWVIVRESTDSRTQLSFHSPL